MTLFIRLAAQTVFLLTAPVLLAHHSGAMFDTSQRLEISGVVTEFSWTNPHASFKVDVTDANGSQAIWAIEMGSPNNLIHEGWKRTTIKSGDKVRVMVSPLRNGKPGGLFLSITLSDGTRLGPQPANSPTSVSAPNAP